MTVDSYGGCGWLSMAMDSYKWLWGLWIAMNGYGWLSMTMDSYGGLWLVMDVVDG